MTPNVEPVRQMEQASSGDNIRSSQFTIGCEIRAYHRYPQKGRKARRLSDSRISTGGGSPLDENCDRRVVFELLARHVNQTNPAALAGLAVLFAGFIYRQLSCALKTAHAGTLKDRPS